MHSNQKNLNSNIDSSLFEDFILSFGKSLLLSNPARPLETMQHEISSNLQSFFEQYQHLVQHNKDLQHRQCEIEAEIDTNLERILSLEKQNEQLTQEIIKKNK